MSDTAPSLSPAELDQLDASVRAALDRGDTDGLHVIGFGEISIALGFPVGDPRVVCKPTSPYTPAEFARYEQLIADYRVALGAIDVNTVDTAFQTVARGDLVVGYSIQPLLASETLADHVLAEAEPDSEHPFLLDLARIIASVTDRLGIDAQVTNWAWEGEQSTLLDLGSPMMWDENGDFMLETGPLFRAIPAPTRPFAARDIAKLFPRYQSPRSVAADVVGNLIRIDLRQWVAPALATFNAVLAPSSPIREQEARALMVEDTKSFPVLKRLQHIERAWVTKIRRHRYDYFIQPTTTSAPS